MVPARTVLALLALAAAVTFGPVAVAQADFTSDYNCTNKPPNQWCDGRSNGSFDGLHSWDWNQGWYEGAAITVCQRVWKPSTGGELGIGPTCDPDGWVGYYYGLVQCACYEAEVKHTSGSNKNILGFANAG
jgi:hypothetical protein